MKNEKKSIHFSDCIKDGLNAMSNIVDGFIKDLYQQFLDFSFNLPSIDNFDGEME